MKRQPRAKVLWVRIAGIPEADVLYIWGFLEGWRVGFLKLEMS